MPNIKIGCRCRDKSKRNIQVIKSALKDPYVYHGMVDVETGYALFDLMYSNDN